MEQQIFDNIAALPKVFVKEDGRTSGYLFGNIGAIASQTEVTDKPNIPIIVIENGNEVTKFITAVRIDFGNGKQNNKDHRVFMRIGENTKLTSDFVITKGQRIRVEFYGGIKGLVMGKTSLVVKTSTPESSTPESSPQESTSSAPEPKSSNSYNDDDVPF